MGTLGIGAIREEVGLDILLAKGEEGRADCELRSLLMPQGVGIVDADIGLAFGNAEDTAITYLDNAIAVSLIAALRCHVL